MLLRFSLGLGTVLLLLSPEAMGPPAGQAQTAPNSPSLSSPLPSMPKPDAPAIAFNATRLRQGSQVVINGIRLQIPWAEALGLSASPINNTPASNAPNTDAAPPANGVLLVSDVALRSLGGIEFLDTDNPYQQPIFWRSNPLKDTGVRLVLPAQLNAQRRYLDITPLIQQARWRTRLDGNSLVIQTPVMQSANPIVGQPPSLSFSAQTIQWSPYLLWKQEYNRLGGAQFPVTQLRFKPEPGVVSLRPIWPTGPSLVGIDRLAQTVSTHQATAAINGGFFNRNNQTPLGAIRTEGQWVSGPILNRGAIAWDDQGRASFGRLALEERLIARDNQPGNNAPQEFPLTALNSGYVKAGFARYTQAWGSSYTPLTDNEVLISVVQGRVSEQRTTDKAGTGSFPIPPSTDPDSYLIVARSNRTGAAKLPPGTPVTLHQQTTPASFANSPHILGAGPLLMQDGRIVLDAAGEGFSQAFIIEQAPRSAIATFKDGHTALITVHNRIGGRGPTLDEMARLMQSMGAVDALNLDGGNSTQLFLGGELLERDPRAAARVHNGLGIFQASPGPTSTSPDFASN